MKTETPGTPAPGISEDSQLISENIGELHIGRIRQRATGWSGEDG